MNTLKEFRKKMESELSTLISNAVNKRHPSVAKTLTATIREQSSRLARKISKKVKAGEKAFEKAARKKVRVLKKDASKVRKVVVRKGKALKKKLR